MSVRYEAPLFVNVTGVCEIQADWPHWAVCAPLLVCRFTLKRGEQTCSVLKGDDLTGINSKVSQSFIPKKLGGILELKKTLHVKLNECKDNISGFWIEEKIIFDNFYLILNWC